MDEAIKNKNTSINDGTGSCTICYQIVTKLKKNTEPKTANTKKKWYKILNNPANTGGLQVIRDKSGRFIEGISGNVKGKPPGSKNYLTQLEETLHDYETEKGKILFKRLIERAFIGDQVMLSVVKKFIPDKQHMEAERPEDVHIFIHYDTEDKTEE